ncbi:hypothetical protein F5Y17DRAFT_427404 [Xylariaceae sp. FL0594]|nr:hypothetical protein F5Y17DRAFT_427404 [Xylariaceae sp. FL0594]
MDQDEQLTLTLTLTHTLTNTHSTIPSHHHHHQLRKQAGGGGSHSPPVLTIVAVSISVVAFLLTAGILAHRFAVRRRQFRPGKGQGEQDSRDIFIGAGIDGDGGEGGGGGARGPGPGSTASSSAGGRRSSHSDSIEVANTYHSVSGGQVRIVIDRATDVLGGRSHGGARTRGDGYHWTEWLWPVPPGHPAHGHYYYGNEHNYGDKDSGFTVTAAGKDRDRGVVGGGRRRAEEDGEIESNTDPNRWSVASKDGSGGNGRDQAETTGTTIPTGRDVPALTVAPRRVGSGSGSGSGRRGRRRRGSVNRRYVDGSNGRRAL